MIRITINIQSSFVLDRCQRIGSDTSVEAAIFSPSRRYVQMTDHVSRLIDVLSYRVPVSGIVHWLRSGILIDDDPDTNLCPEAISLRGSPSRSQVNEGGGDPVAEHLKDTGGPGRNACSMNVYCNSGTVSDRVDRKLRIDLSKHRKFAIS